MTAKRSFERKDNESFAQEANRNRICTDSMLSSLRLVRLERARSLLQESLEHPSPHFRRIAELGSVSCFSKLDLVDLKGAETCQSDEDTLIRGDDSFGTLWSKLVRCGWTHKRGQGLATWNYLRPGLLRGGFSSPSEVLAFVKAEQIDGVSRTGHVDERSCMVPANGRQTISLGESECLPDDEAAPEAAQTPTVADKGTESADAPPAHEGRIVERSLGWGSGSLVKFGLPLNDSEDSNVVIYSCRAHYCYSRRIHSL